MGKRNPKQSSAKAASAASAALKSKKTSKLTKQLAGSVLADYVETKHCKIVPIEEFAYWQITIERPQRDEDGDIITDTRGKKQPDTALRDTERVPFT